MSDEFGQALRADALRVLREAGVRITTHEPVNMVPISVEIAITDPIALSMWQTIGLAPEALGYLRGDFGITYYREAHMLRGEAGGKRGSVERHQRALDIINAPADL